MTSQKTPVSIKTPRTRARLAERKKPYFYQLGPKTPWSLGYRKTSGARVWVLRYRHAGDYRTRRLASADDSAPANGSATITKGSCESMSESGNIASAHPCFESRAQSSTAVASMVASA